MSSIDIIVVNLPHMLRGLQLTLVLSAVGLIGSVALGTVLAVLRMSPWPWLRWIVGLYVDVMRMIPLIMVIFWIFFMIPILTGTPVAPILAASCALIAFHASYMAEIIRAGIQAVPRGLSEAARASGFSYSLCMIHIVLPLAFKHMLPAMVSRLIIIVMSTSLAYTIGVTEFFRAANEVNFRVFRPYEIYLFVGAVYFVLCYGLSLLGQWIAAYLNSGERAIGSGRSSSAKARAGARAPIASTIPDPT